MKLLVFACLVAACYAEIPETFSSKLSITRYRGEHSETGSGEWCRNEMQEEFVYRDTFMNRESNRTERFEMLGLYSKMMRYSILSGPNGTSHCRPEKLPEGSKFPKVWEWLDDPKTTKTEKTLNGTTYTVYTAHERDELIELMVNSKQPDIPLEEVRDGHEGKEVTRFDTFVPGPPVCDFEVPPSCHTPPPRKI